MSHPDWSLLADDIASARASYLIHRDRPAVSALLDQDAAFWRDALDEFGVTAADPDALFAGLVLVHEYMDRLRAFCLLLGRRDVLEVAVAVQQAMTVALVELLPSEVRRG